jgi:hypothetical protein
MRRATTAVFTSLLLTLLPLNSSIAANKSEAEQALQGLLPGNISGDRALVEAFGRGYQRGREAEALSRANQTKCNCKSSDVSRMPQPQRRAHRAQLA